MQARVAISLVATVVAVVACAPAGPRTTATTMSATCSTSNPGAQCNVAIREGSQYRCELGTFDVSPDMLELRGGRPVNIFWSLSAPYAFCGQDQVYLKPGVNKDTLQAYESFGSDNDDGTRGSNEAVKLLVAAGAPLDAKNQFGWMPLTIAKGTTVRWTNNDTIAHTSTSDTGVFSSGNLNAGDHFDFTFQDSGTFPYHCTIHPGMVGTVVVQ